MTGAIKLFLAAQTVLFLAASLVHRGMFVPGFEHAHAGTAETVIGAVLLLGLLASLLRPDAARRVGLAVQGFALLGTLVGLFTIAIGIGPRTTPDLVIHAWMIVLLLAGLWVTWRAGVI
jgi:hypothetical protein